MTDDDASVSSCGSEATDSPERPTTLIYSCVTRIAGRAFLVSLWSDPGSDLVLVVGLDTSTAMGGELWLTKHDYEALGYPPRSKLKPGRVVSEKRMSLTADAMVSRAVRSKLIVVGSGDDKLHLQISTLVK